MGGRGAGLQSGCGLSEHPRGSWEKAQCAVWRRERPAGCGTQSCYACSPCWARAGLQSLNLPRHCGSQRRQPMLAPRPPVVWVCALARATAVATACRREHSGEEQGSQLSTLPECKPSKVIRGCTWESKSGGPIPQHYVSPEPKTRSCLCAIRLGSCCTHPCSGCGGSLRRSLSIASAADLRQATKAGKVAPSAQSITPPAPGLQEHMHMRRARQSGQAPEQRPAPRLWRWHSLPR